MLRCKIYVIFGSINLNCSFQRLSKFKLKSHIVFGFPFIPMIYIAAIVSINLAIILFVCHRDFSHLLVFVMFIVVVCVVVYWICWKENESIHKCWLFLIFSLVFVFFLNFASRRLVNREWLKMTWTPPILQIIRSHLLGLNRKMTIGVMILYKKLDTSFNGSLCRAWWRLELRAIY